MKLLKIPTLGASFLLGVVFQPFPSFAQTQLLMDPGFENECWKLGGGVGLASFSADAAKNGSQGLRLKDDSPDAKGEAYSELLPCVSEKFYQLDGFAKVKVQAYVSFIFYNDQKKVLTGPLSSGAPYDEKDYFLSLLDTLGEWKPFTLKVQAPKEATYVRIFLHTYSKGVGWEADFDDLTLIEP